MRTSPVVRHEADVCVVGGGMAGLCATIASARHGAETLIMRDRPLFGGMASSEMRMHVCGVQVGGGPNLNHSNMRETGIVEELRQANQVYNPQLS